jgi:hypothetical protein
MSLADWLDIASIFFLIISVIFLVWTFIEVHGR